MKTIKDIKNSLDVEILKNDWRKLMADIYDTEQEIENSINIKDLIEVSVSSKIKQTIDDMSTQKGAVRNRKSATISGYVNSINNNEVINFLREVYKTTKNNFVKNVVVSVGKSKTYTDKQITIICDEVAKLDNLIINL